MIQQQPGDTPVLGGALISSQVVEKLLEEMRTGCYAQGARLPAEIELAAHLQVSRTVVRDALSEMEREGFVERVRGIGTVINRRALELKDRMDQKFEYSAMIRAAGRQPNVDMISTSQTPASPEMAALLQIEPGSPIFTIQKRIKADSQPVIYSVDHLPLALFKGEKPEQMDLTLPVFEILEKACGQTVTSTIAHVKAVCPDAALSRTLSLGSGEALLLLDEVCSTRLCQPVLHSYSYYTSFFDFSLLRKLF